jgi:sortase (surface protein transpeptidase)
MLDPSDEVWYYRRVDEQSWMKYRYTVTRSYETVANDGSVFDPLGSGSELTFYTYVPIGTSDKRWIVRANLDSSQQIYYPTMTESYDNMS